MPEPTHYEVLGVPGRASAEQIRAAYRTAARSVHPDAGGSAAAMRRLNAAWHVLRDPGRRAAYDRALVEGPGAADTPSAATFTGRAGDPPEREAEWDEVYTDLLDDEPLRAVHAPEGWWALAPPATLALAVGFILGAFVFSSPAMLVFSGGAFFVATGLFILAPLRAMTRAPTDRVRKR